MKTRTVISVLLVLAAGSLATSVAQAQRTGRRGPRSSRDRSAMTPEDRERMYDHIVERCLERYTSDYELNAEQRDLVRARLEELKELHREYAEPLREEFQALRQEMVDLYRKRHAGEEFDEQRMSEIRDRIRSTWQGSPLMNPERVAEAIEPLLPEEQVKKGRERRAQRRAEWEERRASWGRRREEFRRRGRERDGEQERWRFAARDPWERYVEMFIDRYQLDEPQQASAQSILRTLKEQRDAYRESHEEDFEALREIEDHRERGERYRELNEPVDRLFGELQERLGKIPTSAQIAAAQRSQPTSRPVGVTSRPARVMWLPGGATSRPAGDRFRGFRREGPRRGR